MAQYKKQVDKEHYNNNHYDSVQRFVSYYIQKELVLSKLSNHKFKVLEIGPGTGVLSSYIKNLGYDLKTLDIASDLNPDIVGDVTDLQASIKEKFDIVCCFEVLEHLKFDDVTKAIKSIHKVNKQYLIVSIPQVKIYLSFWTKIPVKKAKQFYISLPYPKTHEFDGQHYWELGTKGYSKSFFLSQFKGFYKLEKEFTEPLDPYHKYFVFKKED